MIADPSLSMWHMSTQRNRKQVECTEWRKKKALPATSSTSSCRSGTRQRGQRGTSACRQFRACLCQQLADRLSRGFVAASRARKRDRRHVCLSLPLDQRPPHDGNTPCAKLLILLRGHSLTV